MAKADSPTRGRELNIHFGGPERGFIGQISHLGDMVPVMAGVTLGFRIRGEDRVGLVYVGDWRGVAVFDPQGRFLGRVPKMGLDWSAAPGAMAFNDQNDLFVTQGWQGKILKLAVDLSPAQKAP